MNARALALTALSEWRRGKQFADAIIQRLLSESKLATPDRGFANELFYGVLRNLTLLDFWIGILRPAEVDPATRDLLRLGLYQIAMLKTPTHAAVFETVELAPKRARGLVNAVLRSADRRAADLNELTANQPLHIRASHPEFLVRKWTRQFAEAATEELCFWNNRPAPVYVRINQLKTTAEEFPSSSLLPNDNRFASLPEPRAALEAGTCYAQDPSTAVACDSLGAKPDELVLDACAAPGGKTSFIAQMMLNRGTIVACDRAPDRVILLRGNLQRLGVESARVVQHDWRSDTLPTELAEMRFDRILVDAPCSNTGVMRRRVDLRWRLRPEDFTRMPNEQFEIVRHIVPLLRPGGVLVYSTCSIEPEENERVVERIIAAFPFLKLIDTKSILPFRDHFDGAFAAQLTHTG
ncbi:MAG: 16S rRNA (cytosine(967)-C(5))-methyltransferase RsmB [Chthoniobacterales bacterium]